MNSKLFGGAFSSFKKICYVYIETILFLCAFAFVCGTTIYHFFSDTWHGIAAALVVLGLIILMNRQLKSALRTIEFWKERANNTQGTKELEDTK